MYVLPVTVIAGITENYMIDTPVICGKQIFMVNATQIECYKRKYHPLIILMYISNMLSHEQLRQFPYNTLRNWKNFRHEDYFGYDMVECYINQLDDIKKVYSRKFLNRAVRSLILLSDGYHELIGEIENNKKLLREHSARITLSISRMAAYTGSNIKGVSKLFGVSKDWFYRHRDKSKCQLSKTGKCFRQYPNQLSLDEVSMIDEIVSIAENQRKTKNTLYFTALRSGMLACGYSTFCKYAKIFGHKGRVKKKPKDKPKGFKASRIFEWLHVDVTFVQTVKDGIQKVVFIKDNYSKGIFHHGSTDVSADSSFIKKLFEETFAKYGLLDQKLPINILSDGGPENKGKLLDWINSIGAPPIIRKITACTPDFPFSNSMSESTHSIYKSEFMQGKFSYDKAQHLRDLESFVHEYNYERFPVKLFGLAPMEIVEKGEKPDRRRFREQKAAARIKRIETNRNFNQCLFPGGCGVSN